MITKERLALETWLSQQVAAEALPVAIRTTVEAAVLSRDEDDLFVLTGELIAIATSQDALHPAAPAVATLLVRLAGTVAPDLAWVPLASLVPLHRACWSWRRRLGHPARRSAYPPVALSASAEVCGRLAHDRVSGSVERALGEEVPRLRALLGTADERGRAHCAFTLSQLGRRGRVALPDLLALAAKEARPDVSASLIASVLALGDAAADLEGTGAVADALRHISEDADPRPAAEALCDYERLSPELFPFYEGIPGGFVGDLALRGRLPRETAMVLLEAVGRRPFVAGQREMELLEHGLAYSERDVLADLAILVAFADHFGRPTLVEPAELDDLQVSVLRALGEESGLDCSTYHACGLLNPWGAGRAYTEPRSSPLDRRVRGTWTRQVVRWPVWKWLRQGRLVAELGHPPEAVWFAVCQRLVHEMGASEVIDCCRECVTGAWDLDLTDAVGLLRALRTETGLDREALRGIAAPTDGGLAEAVSIALALEGESPRQALARVAPRLPASERRMLVPSTRE